MIVQLNPPLIAKCQPEYGIPTTVSVHALIINPETGKIVRIVGIDEYGIAISEDELGVTFQTGVPLNQGYQR